MHTAKQFSIASVNKPGRLTAVLEAMRKEKVEIEALAVMDARHTLRFVPNEADAAAGALTAINVPYDMHDVLVVELPNQAGAYPHLCERLAAAHLEMDYSYSSCRPGKRAAMAVVKVNDLTKAQRLLSESNANGTKRKPVKRPPARRLAG